MIATSTPVGPVRRAPFAVLAGVCVLLFGAAYVYYRSLVRDIKDEQYEAISAIGAYKADQVRQWRAERLTDASQIAASTYFRRGLEEFLRDPAQPELLRRMKERLSVERTPFANDAVFLLSPGGAVLASVGDAGGSSDSVVHSLVGAALANPSPVVSNFHRHADGVVHVAAAQAVRDDRGDVLAVVVLRTDAAHYLYPLIRSWPGRSRTGETLLLQREGNALVFVNAPRPSVDAALSVRLPLTRTEFPAVQAALGRRGRAEGDDYRGVPVLADLRGIADSPWLLVSKIDEGEIVATARERTALVVVVLALLALLSGTALAYDGRKRQARLFRDLYEAERRNLAAEAMFRTTLYSIGDAVVTTDVAGRIRGMNRVAERLTGWTESDARGKRFEQVVCLVNEHTRAPAPNAVADVLRTGAMVELPMQMLLIGRDGSEHPVADCAAPIRDASGTVSGVVQVLADETTQRAAQHALAESEERWMFALEGAGEGVWDWNLVTNEVLYSRRWKEMLGYSEAEIGTGFAEFGERVAAEDLARVLADVRAHRAGETPAYETEFRMRCKDGSWKWISARGMVTGRGANGQPLRMIGTHADITGRKRDEALLQTRLHLSQCSLTHSAGELLQVTLDDAKRLTGSDAGFCHVAGPGRNAVSHEGWPAGRVPVARELVVPVVRDGRVVMQLGVGNKPTEYDQQDAATLSALADLCWGIVTRRQLEESLHANEAHLTAILESTTDGVLAVDTNGHVVKANRRFAELWRIPDDVVARGNDSEMLGVVVNQLQDPDAFLDKVQSLYHSDVTEQDSIAFKDGRVFERSTSAMVMGGVVTGRVWSFRDVTERKVADAALRLQGAALNVAANPMVITDRDAVIEWVNAAFTSVTGFPAHEAVGEDLRVLLSSGVHDREFYAAMWDTILTGEAWHGEMTNRRKDGTWYPEDVTITPVKDARGEVTHCIAITRDLTQEKAKHAQFLQAQKMESVGRLAGGIAHDFNNLLTVITNTVDIISENVRPDDPLRADLEEIQHAGERAAALTRQLLAFSRREVLKPELVQLSVMVEELQPMLQRLIGEDVDVVFPAGTPTGCIRADLGQVEQVVLNLVVNARDAMPDGGTLTIAASDVHVDAASAAELGALQPGPYVMLSVSDTGIGMDKETRLKIFEPFFTTKAQGQGTGLGLATVYGIVQQSGGAISVDSELGRGTTFTVYLPRVPGDVPGSRSASVRKVQGGKETILIVEDEAPVLRTSTRILRSAGYTVLTASDGMEALRVLEGHDGTVHLLLTDVVMPGVGGRELAGWLADIRPEIKVIYTSGYTDDAILRHGVLDRSAHFISKPYKRATLTRKIREVLDSVRSAAPVAGS